jgi:hypothetical protein
MKKIIINGRRIRNGRITDSEILNEIDAPFSAEFLVGEEGEAELLVVNAEETPSAEDVIEELEESGIEEPIEVIIVGAESAEDLIAIVEEEYNSGDNVEALKEALESDGGEPGDDEGFEDEPGDDEGFDDEEPAGEDSYRRRFYQAKTRRVGDTRFKKKNNR